MKIGILLLSLILILSIVGCDASNPAVVDDNPPIDVNVTGGSVTAVVPNPLPVSISGVGITDSHLDVLSEPYFVGVAESEVPNHYSFEKAGWEASVSTSMIDVCGLGAVYVPPSSAMQMSVKSTDNTNDKGGGTGAFSVELHYLDNLYNEQSTTITLNGTTWVDTTPTNILRVQSFHVLTAGTGGYPAGDITIADKATRTVVYSKILAGYNRAWCIFWTVPNGKSLYLTAWHVSSTSGASKNARFILKATVNEHTLSNLWWGIDQALVQDGSDQIDFAVPYKIPQYADVKVSVIGSGALSASAQIDGWYEDN